MIRLQDPFPYKGKIFLPFGPTSSNYSASIPHQPYPPVSLLTQLSHDPGSKSYFGSVFSHDPHWLPCIQCVVIVLLLVSWSDNPHLLLSSFNPYLSDPHTLLLLIHDSHNVVFPLFSLSHDSIAVLLIFGELSHYLVTVTHHMSHTLGTIYV